MILFVRGVDSVNPDPVPLPDLASTEELAARLAPALRRGDMLALKGPLGAGKTAFARALLKAFGILDDVPSPTFTLLQTYDAPDFPIYHFDLYRLKSEAELDELGWEDALADGFVLVEWPERAGNRLPEDRLVLRFTMDEKGQRQCALEPHGDWTTRLKEPSQEEKGNKMAHRAVEIAGFLAQNGWDRAHSTPMDADFSPRRYARLENNDGRRAILMDADPDQKISAFVTVAGLLRRNGITVPEIFAADPARGLVLMEDFGNRNFGRMIDSGIEAAPLYRRAVDVLVHLHKTFDTSMTQGLDLPVFNGGLFATQAELYLDAYIPHIKGREATHEERQSFRLAWTEALRNIEILPKSLMLRDFMPDNLMDLPEREGWNSIGVLDFQDAGLGPIAYDLASLCETVRRDGGDALMDEIIACYHQNAWPAVSAEELRTACRVLAAQRHMRVLGIITQWTRKTGRRDKLAWLPRIKNYLEHLLKDEALKPVRLWTEQHYKDDKMAFNQP